MWRIYPEAGKRGRKKKNIPLETQNLEWDDLTKEVPIGEKVIWKWSNISRENGWKYCILMKGESD